MNHDNQKIKSNCSGTIGTGMKTMPTLPAIQNPFDLNLIDDIRTILVSSDTKPGLIINRAKTVIKSAGLSETFYKYFNANL